MSPFYIACEMIAATLFTLLWASSLFALSFSCFRVNILIDFCVIALAKENLGQSY